MSRENVKAFYARLASDEAFRTQIQSVKDKAECSQIIKSAGYDFTSVEFEEYTAQLLESGVSDNELQKLNEKELSAVFGGATSVLELPEIGQIYGSVNLSPTFSPTWIQ